MRAVQSTVVVNAQADALVRGERRDKPERSLIDYEEMMALCDSQEAITMPGSAPATTTALLRLYGAHNWDCTLKTRRGSFDSSNE